MITGRQSRAARLQTDSKTAVTNNARFSCPLYHRAGAWHYTTKRHEVKLQPWRKWNGPPSRSPEAICGHITNLVHTQGQLQRTDRAGKLREAARGSSGDAAIDRPGSGARPHARPRHRTMGCRFYTDAVWPHADTPHTGGGKQQADTFTDT